MSSPPCRLPHSLMYSTVSPCMVPKVSVLLPSAFVSHHRRQCYWQRVRKDFFFTEFSSTNWESLFLEPFMGSFVYSTLYLLIFLFVSRMFFLQGKRLESIWFLLPCYCVDDCTLFNMFVTPHPEFFILVVHILIAQIAYKWSSFILFKLSDQYKCTESLGFPPNLSNTLQQQMWIVFL